MYIPYEQTGNLIDKFIKNKKLHSFFYNKKIEQNIGYIEKNKPNVLKKLKRKLENGEKLNIVFYVYDETKWKCQSLYNLLSSDKRFGVKILVTKTACQNEENSSYISDKEVEKTYNYFKQKGLNTEYAYDTEYSRFIPLKSFNPDIIFYQHPWYVKTEQGPVVCSKFALTCYIPYYYPIELSDIDYKLRFHKYVEKYYILDNYTKEKCLQNAPELKDKLKVVGYPYLDYFNTNSIAEENCIIYAPHWTIGENGICFGTFKWNGRFILDYAQKHPETKWIFKPHPLLKKALTDFGIMTEEEVNRYYSGWGKLGIKYESGDYLELFGKSKLMITDCGSFLGEYFGTGKPLIHLMSEKSVFKNSENPILRTYYRANNLEELKYLLEILPQNDYMKKERICLTKKMNIKGINASENILNDIINEIYSV